jgi:catechol 2,3-dioxygenase-like lactoylglutathione lyase family enzyme
MLGDITINAVVAVKDMDAAKEFYEGKLGLQSEGDDPDGTYYKCGSSRLLVYKSQFAGTNQATGAGWRTDDIESLVSELKAKGVVFEHYDMPNVKREGDIHIYGDDEFKAVWFKDPDGNIFAVDQRK